MKTIATVTNLRSNLIINHDRKELIKRYLVISSILETTIDCRLYKGRSVNASVVYCDLWVYGFNFYGSGNGAAGRYGYDKIQAAVQAAIRNAGITTMNGGIYQEVEDTLLSIAEALDSTLTYRVFR